MKALYFSFFLLAFSFIHSQNTLRPFNLEEKKALAEAHKLWSKMDSLHLKSLQSRLDFVSHEWLNRPYFLGPMGEGTSPDSLGKTPLDPRPRIQLEHFDCVTFVEQALAISLANKKSLIYPLLSQIRYTQNQEDYVHRNHFFEADWIPHNSKYLNPLKTPNDAIWGRKAIGKKLFFSKKNIPYDGTDPEVKRPFLFFKDALELMDKPWTESPKVLLVAITGHTSWIWVTHTGFIFLNPGQKPLFKHASLSQKKVVQQNFSDYLQGRGSKSVEGILLFEINDLNSELNNNPK
jgi:hypothetical protein